MSKNMVEPEGTQTMWCPHVPYRISKPTHVQAHTSTHAPTPPTPHMHTHTHALIPVCIRTRTYKYVILTAFPSNSGYVNVSQC